MPIRWTALADQTLLLKILETQDLTVDHAKVAAAWPGPPENQPTARAIKERIAKIKEISRDPSSAGLGQSSPSPRKGRKPAAKSTAAKSTAAKKTGGKRKRKPSPSPEIESDEGASDIASHIDDPAVAPDTQDPESPVMLAKVILKTENSPDDDDFERVMHSSEEC
ncbi:uncharacterized protein N7498_003158 [Penicillium cinerascens]|uniref:Uncharacterized protein n=1 Tax=Penicillium cinerascens TaxID=70096 RepID=A0A9W9N1L3_9EURO|nr:uncharacterized protein N7498_003158 [Penicillium cinerascens]KAJ5211512.1 hypothetical protein N7498_003158 [Penicillium cinerascens]